MITPLDIAVLAALARYYCLCRPQLQTLCFPTHSDGRALRNRLAKLRQGGYVTKTRSLIPYRGGSSGCPVWYLTREAAELLREYFDDESYLALNTRPPRDSLLFHWLAIGDTHIALDKAVDAHQGDVSLTKWTNEWEVVNKDAARAGQFCLHTVFRENPPLSCSPDAAWLLGYGEHQIVFYLEQDRNTSGVRSIAASKTNGYAELAQRNGHRTHFPETTLDRFRVLMVTTHHGRRKALAQAIKGKERADLWLFACQDDLTAESFPFGDVFYDCHGTAGPLIRKQRPDGEAA